MQSCHRLLPSFERSRNRPPPAHPGLTAPGPPGSLAYPLPSSAQIPKQPLGRAAFTIPCVLLSPCPAPQDRGCIVRVDAVADSAEYSLSLSRPAWKNSADRLCCDSGPHTEAPGWAGQGAGLVFLPHVGVDGLGAHQEARPGSQKNT